MNRAHGTQGCLGSRHRPRLPPLLRPSLRSLREDGDLQHIARLDQRALHHITKGGEMPVSRSCCLVFSHLEDTESDKRGSTNLCDPPPEDQLQPATQYAHFHPCDYCSIGPPQADSVSCHTLTSCSSDLMASFPSVWSTCECVVPRPLPKRGNEITAIQTTWSDPEAANGCLHLLAHRSLFSPGTFWCRPTTSTYSPVPLVSSIVL